MVRHSLAAAALALAVACLPPPSPAQQLQDGETAIACVSREWGQPIDVLAKDCAGGVVTVVVDIIADISVLLPHDASNPYANDARVQKSVRARFADGGAPAPGTGPGPAGLVPAPETAGHLAPR